MVVFWGRMRQGATMTDQLIGKAEIFQFTDESGTEQWLAIEPLRHWAEANCEPRGVPIDIRKVEDMFANGRIDPEHLRKHTMQRDPRPIIVCKDFQGIASEIVDGNHTYAAMASALMMAEREGIQLPGSPNIPGYVITRAQMERFLVPLEARTAGPAIIA